MAKGIYKRKYKQVMKDGTVKIKESNVFWVRYADLYGKIQRESSHSTRFADAQALLTKRKHEKDKGQAPEITKKIKNHNFNQLADEYKRWCERQKSFKSKSYLIKQLKEIFGNLPLRRFNTMLIEQYQTERLKKSNKPANGKPDTGNKPATINRLIATLKHMFTKAVEWEMIEEIVLKKIRKVKMLPENNKRLRYLSKQECKELLSQCESHLKPIVITALHTGMRKGEVLNLKWESVDLKHGFILLDKTKNGDRREIPINGTLRNTVAGLTRRLDVPYVFYDKDTCKPYGDVKRSFATALRRAKIHDFRFHDLRHTFASHLIMAGVDIQTVMELLGHKTLTMTLRYAHLAPSHKVKAVDLLDTTLNENELTQKLTQSSNRVDFHRGKYAIL